MKMGDLVKWLLLGGAAYWIYETWFATPTTTTPATTTPATTTPATTTPATTTPDTFNSLAAIYQRMIRDAVANTPSATQATIALTADQWSFYLARQSSVTPPDMASVFTFTSDHPRTATMTAAQYWAVVEPYLVKQGMSGLSLYRGMGRFYLAKRWAA